MKDKTAAAKILLDNGWTLDEVNEVLGEEVKVTINPISTPVIFYPYIQPIPYPETQEPIYRRIEITCEGKRQLGIESITVGSSLEV